MGVSFHFDLYFSTLQCYVLTKNNSHFFLSCFLLLCVGVGFREMCMVFGLLCLVYAPFVCCLKKLDAPKDERRVHEMSRGISVHRSINGSENRSFSSSAPRTISGRSSQRTNEHGVFARGGAGQLSIDSLNGEDEGGVDVTGTPQKLGTTLPNAAYSYGEPRDASGR